MKTHSGFLEKNCTGLRFSIARSVPKPGSSPDHKSDSGTKSSLKITSQIFSMFPQPFRRETEIENFSNLSIRKYLRRKSGRMRLTDRRCESRLNRKFEKISCKSFCCRCTRTVRISVQFTENLVRRFSNRNNRNFGQKGIDRGPLKTEAVKVSPSTIRWTTKNMKKHNKKVN